KRNQFITSFYTHLDSLIRMTDVSNRSDLNGYSLNTSVRLNRKFKRRDRRFRMNYNYVLNDNESVGKLNSTSTGSDTLAAQDINQKKINELNSQSHNALFVYTEPLTKKVKLEFEYNLNITISKQRKETKDFENGDYSLLNPFLTNVFENQRIYHSVGAKFIYEVKKYSFNMGTRARTASFVNTNLINKDQFEYRVNNLLPYLFYMYKFSDNNRISFRYNTFSNQPSIEQLQPVPDNSNPNQIKLGNADLKPTFNHNFSLFYNLFRPISGRSVWLMSNFTVIDNAFTNSIQYDSIGRTITQSQNVDGNYNSNASLYFSLPFFNKKITIDPNFSFNYTKNSNYINEEKNITKTAGYNLSAPIGLELDTLNFRVGYDYSYNIPSSSLNKTSSKPYSEQEFSGFLFLKLPFKFSLETSAQYIINSNLTSGYNINYLLWNASINKAFLKNENLIVSVTGNDLLNQNINTSRTVQDNVITDSKTTIISRYFLLKLTFRFNNNKTKENDYF
ncbi:MAG TPA: outer membrane beta-barrel protein, partial [Bacteroidia bacterium]|nr:outer membrane beta-barrel protein [Bacteroidia bacterium]